MNVSGPIQENPQVLFDVKRGDELPMLFYASDAINESLLERLRVVQDQIQTIVSLTNSLVLLQKGVFTVVQEHKEYCKEPYKPLKDFPK